MTNARRRRAAAPAPRIALAALAALAGWTTGCDRGGEDAGAVLRALSPPREWADRIASDRRAKDAFFRESAESPVPPERQAAFDGLAYWEPDPRYYLVGKVRFYVEPERFEIPTTNGDMRPCARVGFVEFQMGGALQRLSVYQLLDQQPTDEGPKLFLPFADATTGEETYPAGRYVDLEGPPGGPYVLDFNRAKNPFCAYGAPERYACPVTPRENRLQVRIEAGERGYLEAPPVVS